MSGEDPRFIARRIVTYSTVGDLAVQGERFGIIRFGSRVDVFMPVKSTVRVKVGDITAAISAPAANEGERGSAGGQAGHLYLRIRIAPHAVFERQGKDVRTRVTVRIEYGIGAAMLFKLFRVVPGNDLHQPLRSHHAFGDRVETRLDAHYGQNQQRIHPKLPADVESTTHQPLGRIYCHLVPA